MRKSLSGALIALAITATAQDPDSLRGIWKNQALHDTVRLEALNQLIWQGYMYTQPDSAYLLAQELATEATNCKRPAFIARSLSLQGVSWFVRGDMPKGTDLFIESAAAFAKAGEKRGQCSVLGNAGAALIEQGEYDRALDIYRQVEGLSTELKDSISLARAFNGTGRVYALKGDLARATGYLDRGLRLAETIHDEASVAIATGHLANMSADQQDYDRARELFERSLLAFDRSGDTKNMSTAQLNLGGVCEAQKDYVRAMTHYTLALDLCKRVGNIYVVPGVYIAMSSVYRKMGEPARALLYADSALTAVRRSGELPAQSRILSKKGALQLLLHDPAGALASGKEAMAIAREQGGLVEEKEAAEMLFAVYEAKGDKGNALAMHKRYVELKDSLLSTDNQRAVLRQEYRYSYEKEALADSLAEAEKARLADLRFQEALGRERSVRNIILGASAVVLILFSLLGYSLYKRREQERRLAAVEVERLRQESLIADLRIRDQVARDMHDDLGSGLSALKLRSEIAVEAERDPAKREQLATVAGAAGELIGSMRQIVWALNSSGASLAEVVAYLRDHAHKWCSEHGLYLEVVADDTWPERSLTTEQRRNILLVVKEALHNITKHARATRVTVDVRWESGLRVTVADDGIGYEADARGHGGNGLGNMAKRIDALGGTLRMDGTQGTHISFHVPLPATVA